MCVRVCVCDFDNAPVNLLVSVCVCAFECHYVCVCVRGCVHSQEYRIRDKYIDYFDKHADKKHELDEIKRKEPK